MVKVGEQLVLWLEQRLPLTAGFWLYVPETNTWRLVVVAPQVREQGTLKIYQEAQRALMQFKNHERQNADLPFSLPDVYAIDDRQQLVGTLRTLAERQGRSTDLRVSRTTANGHFIEDAYIYTT